MAALLSQAPDIIRAPNARVVQIAMYTNPALQLATLGEPPGGQDFSAWANATDWLKFPSCVAELAREPRRRDTCGFEARQVNQALELGEPPNRVKLLRGRFNLEEPRSASVASGYAPVEMPGAEAYSWGAEPDHDIESNVTQLGVGT